MSASAGTTETAGVQRRIRILDVVAITTDVPEHGLLRGHVGTAVEPLNSGAFEVEFSDDDGKTYALVALRAEQLMVLHYRPVRTG